MSFLPADAMILAIFVPLLAGSAAFVDPRRVFFWGLLGTWALPLAAWVLAGAVLDEGPVLHSIGGWKVPLGISLRADGLSVTMLLVVALVAPVLTLYARAYLHRPAGAARGERYHWPLWLLLIAALNALFLSADIFNLYVTLELAGLAAVSLVALAGESRALDAALRYLFVGLGGSLLYLLAVALIYGVCGTLDLAMLARCQPGRTVVPLVALSLATSGMMMKGALLPAHFWLPPAHANAPAPVSAALSALVVKGPIYILLRFWFEGLEFVVTPLATQLLGVFGAAAIVWGSVQALLQTRLKRLIAYSTVAQLGYLLLIFPLAANVAHRRDAWVGGLVLLLSHAAAKAAMFMAAGNILRAAGHDRIADLDGVVRALPVSVFAIGLAGVSLVGLPPSAGFVGKWHLLMASLQQGQWWWVVVLLVGSLLAAAYVLRILTHAFTNVTRGPEHRVPGVMEWSSFFLALASMGLGMFSGWPIRVMDTLFAVGGVR